MLNFGDLTHARALANALQRDDDAPVTDSAKGRLTGAMVEYVLDFRVAKQKRYLHEFDVQRRLDSLHRVANGMFNSTRSLAGLCILAGLLFTMYNLQRAVGTLGEDFRNLASQQAKYATPANKPSDDLASPDDSTNRITTAMSQMAAAAGQAFRFSLVAIGGAVLLLIWTLQRQRYASTSVDQFSSWAVRVYRNDLPEQISIGEAAVAFKENAAALGGLTQSFNDLSFALTAMKNFSRTMDDTRAAIVEALSAMPAQLQQSIGTITAGMVRNLEKATKEGIESSNKILAIYGQQEFRIAEIRQEVAAVRGFTEQIVKGVKVLEGVPGGLTEINSSLLQHVSSAQRIEASARHLEGAVKDFPSGDLVETARALTKATKQITTAHEEAIKAIQVIEAQTLRLGRLELVLGNKQDTIADLLRGLTSGLDHLKSEFANDIQLTSGKLEGLVSAVVDEVNKLADRSDSSTILLETQRIDSTLKAFLSRLRIKPQSGDWARDPNPIPDPNKTAEVHARNDGSDSGTIVTSGSDGETASDSVQMGVQASDHERNGIADFTEGV